MAWIQSTMQNGLERELGLSKLLSGQTDNFKIKQVLVSKFARWWTNVVLTHRFLDDQAGGFSIVENSAADLLPLLRPKWSGVVECSTPVFFFRKVWRMEVVFHRRRDRLSRLFRRTWGGDELRTVARSVVVGNFWSWGVVWDVWPGNGNMAFPLNWLWSPFGSFSYFPLTVFANPNKPKLANEPFPWPTICPRQTVCPRPYPRTKYWSADK